MESLLLSIEYSDPLWLAIAFLCGLLSRQVGLPPLVGYLVAGFVLHGMGAEGGDFLGAVADLGVTLLLFTIGLKLKLTSLLRPEIWAVASIHMVVSIIVAFALLMGLSLTGLWLFGGLGATEAALIAFALSFSSTVFAVKVLEDKGATISKFGRTAIGVLIIQDIVAVIFLAISSGKVPSPLAVGLILLIPLRPVFLMMLRRTGHGELLTLFGLLLALGGASIFEVVGMKGDLGALVLGILLSGHKKTNELARSLLDFKDLFLVGFFLSIGLTGIPDWEAVFTAVILVLLIPVKVVLYVGLFLRYKMRAGAAYLASLSLANYSEFGLIVGAIAASAGWIASDWLVAFAIALSFSFVFASVLNRLGDTMFDRVKTRIAQYESEQRLPGDGEIYLSGVKVLIFGMGRVGAGAYDTLTPIYGESVLGVDMDERRGDMHNPETRRVLQGDATNSEFWQRLNMPHDAIEMILLALPTHEANLMAITTIRGRGYDGFVAAVSKYDDQGKILRENGVDEVVNLYAEAGSGFAEHARLSFLGEASPLDKPAPEETDGD
ncbi:MAG: cation:proton antiporter [Magnetospiraceae bacterium]